MVETLKILCAKHTFIGSVVETLMNCDGVLKLTSAGRVVETLILIVYQTHLLSWNHGT